MRSASGAKRKELDEHVDSRWSVAAVWLYKLQVVGDERTFSNTLATSEARLVGVLYGAERVAVDVDSRLDALDVLIAYSHALAYSTSSITRQVNKKCQKSRNLDRIANASYRKKRNELNSFR